ncbi:TCP-1-like chaperonin intermediate domain superfamily [Arabidopsis suecica]|uniref:TCP-1-like chaperonin intermediate domain superfamily n=1 Tax=Arabidopsis suecica TaxID=45249 RepID=A0A8T1ZFL0_ARASU|nr:TCP-1-like chaperonin intermediate domain superfamily [Arabidopsis suecica]
MDKMISTVNGEVIITNDGATILNKMEVLQPATKMLVELSKSQDSAAGEGTTTVVVIAGDYILTAMAVPVEAVELTDRDSLAKSASTSLNSKVVSQYPTLLAPLAVDAVLSVIDPEKPEIVVLCVVLESKEFSIESEY